jgi:hypothetical protein
MAVAIGAKYGGVGPLYMKYTNFLAEVTFALVGLGLLLLQAVNKTPRVATRRGMVNIRKTLLPLSMVLLDCFIGFHLQTQIQYRVPRMPMERSGTIMSLFSGKIFSFDHPPLDLDLP